MSFVAVGIDGSEAAAHALRFAIEEAKMRQLPLRVVAAWEVPAAEYIGGALLPNPDLADLARENADAALVAAVEQARQAGVEAEGVEVEGHPGRVLVEQAQGATLLVVGSRGRGGFASLVLGSVSQAVAHHAPCALAIVRGRN
ncbi:MAG TPA: universal stress protein [Gaiellaceae bacterium]|jgi:nucleotide-binding universal stress UspA family protein|nr:universal stress protein [Gaiellaceae bacterium]